MTIIGIVGGEEVGAIVERTRVQVERLTLKV